MGPSASRRRASTSTAGLDARNPARTNKNCARLVSFWMGWAVGNGAMGGKRGAAGLPPTAKRPLPQLSGELLAALGASARQHLLAALGGHTGAEAMATLTNEPARLVGPLGAHDDASMLNGPAWGRKMKGRGLPQALGSVKDQGGTKALATTNRIARAQSDPKKTRACRCRGVIGGIMERLLPGRRRECSRALSRWRPKFPVPTISTAYGRMPDQPNEFAVWFRNGTSRLTKTPPLG